MAPESSGIHLVIYLFGAKALNVCFYLTFVFQSVCFRTPCPVSVKQMEHEEDEDGIADENIKRNPEFAK